MEIENKCFCNLCGSMMDEFDIQQNAHIRTRLGYGSRYDGDEIEIHLCSSCIDRLIDRCGIEPQILNVGVA